MVFELVDPGKHVLLKFVKAEVTEDDRSRLMVREGSCSWEVVKAILEENYATRRTLDYCACKMFSARQDKNESKIGELQTDLREAARRVCRPEEILGAIGLINHLGKVCLTNAFKLLFGVEESQSFCPRLLNCRWKKKALFFQPRKDPPLQLMGHP